MKLEVKYLFTTSFSGAKFYIYQLPEGLGMRKTLTHGIFMDFHGVMQVQSLTCTHSPHKNFISCVANPEIVY